MVLGFFSFWCELYSFICLFALNLWNMSRVARWTCLVHWQSLHIFVCLICHLSTNFQGTSSTPQIYSICFILTHIFFCKTFQKVTHLNWCFKSKTFNYKCFMLRTKIKKCILLIWIVSNNFYNSSFNYIVLYMYGLAIPFIQMTNSFIHASLILNNYDFFKFKFKSTTLF